MRPDNEILKGIAENNHAVINEIYINIFPQVNSYILTHGGSEAEAQDIFQDALLVILQRINREKLEIHCKFNTYIYAICKKIWIQNRKKHQSRMNKMKEMDIAAEPETPYGSNEEDRQRLLFEKHFNNLSPDCQKLLRLSFNDLKIEEIMDIMGIKTLERTSDRKYRCKKNLIERIKKDPDFLKVRKTIEK